MHYLKLSVNTGIDIVFFFFFYFYEILVAMSSFMLTVDQVLVKYCMLVNKNVHID